MPTGTASWQLLCGGVTSPQMLTTGKYMCPASHLTVSGDTASLQIHDVEGMLISEALLAPIFSGYEYVYDVLAEQLYIENPLPPPVNVSGLILGGLVSAGVLLFLRATSPSLKTRRIS